MEDILQGKGFTMESISGTREAWVAAALECYERPLLQYAARITQNAETARDVVQETFLRLCQADPAKIGNHLAPWLYTVCRNHALTVCQKEARMNRLYERQAATPDPPPAPESVAASASALAERQEFHQQVRAIVDGLPHAQQEAFWLKFRDGLTYREISGIMGVSLGTVSAAITAALNVLRHELRSELDQPQEVSL